LARGTTGRQRGVRQGPSARLRSSSVQEQGNEEGALVRRAWGAARRSSWARSRCSTLAGDLRAPGFDASRWWIDLRPLPHARDPRAAHRGVVCATAAGPRPAPRARRARAGRRPSSPTLFLLAVTASNAVTAVVHAPRGPRHRRVLGALLAGRHPRPRGGARLALGRADPAPRAGALAARSAALARPCSRRLGQMLSFGRTDYRRPADVDRRLRRARLRRRPPLAGPRATASTPPRALYRAGLAPRVIMSRGARATARRTRPSPCATSRCRPRACPRAPIVRDPGGPRHAQHRPHGRRALPRRGLVQAARGEPRVPPRAGEDDLRAGGDGRGVHGAERGLARASRALRFMAREVAAMWFYYAHRDALARP
jgi:hypothetical protein